MAHLPCEDYSGNPKLRPLLRIPFMGRTVTVSSVLIKDVLISVYVIVLYTVL